MTKTHYTARGEPLDISSLALRHANTVAVGNARMNARGDVIGEKGVVLKTQEQIEEEWRRDKERRQSNVGQQPSSDIKAPPLTPEQAVAMMKGKKLTDDQDFDPGSTPTTSNVVKDLVDKQSAQGAQRRRRIVESD